MVFFCEGEKSFQLVAVIRGDPAVELRRTQMGIDDRDFVFSEFFEKSFDFLFAAEFFFAALIAFKPSVIAELSVAEPDGIFFEFGKRPVTSRLPDKIAESRNSENNCQCGGDPQRTHADFFPKVFFHLFTSVMNHLNDAVRTARIVLNSLCLWDLVCLIYMRESCFANCFL